MAARLGQHRALPGTRHILPRLNPTSAFGSTTDSLVSELPAQLDGQLFSLGPRVEGALQISSSQIVAEASGQSTGELFDWAKGR